MRYVAKMKYSPYAWALTKTLQKNLNKNYYTLDYKLGMTRKTDRFGRVKDVETIRIYIKPRDSNVVTRIKRWIKNHVCNWEID
jgi:hypothetical protein